MLDNDVLGQKLKEEFNYPEHMIPQTVARLNNMDAGLKKEFEQWLAGGDLPDREIGGYSIKRLVNEYNMLIPGAFLTMDWLIKEPEIALSALKEGYCSK